MREVARGARLVAFFGMLLASAGCSGSKPCSARAVTSEEACKTTADCVAAGFSTLSCISGVCRRGCTTDEDCSVGGSDEGDACEGGGSTAGPAVCEAQLCVPGCPEAPCAAGETCVRGRCALAFEGFELPGGADAATLATLGWNGLPKELDNFATLIVESGSPGCSLGDPRCAGPASEGDRFVTLARVPTSEKGTPSVGFTCRSCACCLECQLSPPPSGVARVPECPRDPGVAVALMCPASPPAVCEGVCTDCEACVLADSARLGERLLACETAAARRTCPACSGCDAEGCEGCRAASCPDCRTDPAGTACQECEQRSCPSCEPCRACVLCSEALECGISDPGGAECIAKRGACDAMGRDGCYPTPVHYPRAELTDAEQALVSPEMRLAGVEGEVVLELDHVPFDVGEAYRPGQQGVPASTWSTARQEVVIELCAGRCEDPASWRPAELTTGDTASFPPLAQRRNGLSLGRQTSVDWRGGRVRASIPAELFTNTFRFRIVPRLAEDVRVGIDNVLVRRKR